MLIARLVCPRYNEALTAVLASPALQQINDANAELYETTVVFSGSNVTNPLQFYPIYDTVRSIVEDVGLPAPPGAEVIYPNVASAQTLFSLVYDILVWTPEMKRIRSCRFIERLASEFAAKLNGSLERQISMFVGYDYTLSNILDAFGVRNGTYMAEGYTVLFELLRKVDTDEVVVELSLRKDENSGAIPLPLPGCGESCPLNQFLTLARRLSCRGWDRLCRLRDPNFTVSDPSAIEYNL